MKKLFGTICAYFKELGSLTPIAFVTAFLPMLGSAILILLAHPLGNWLRENWEIGMPLYLLGILFFCGLALLPTNVIGIVAVLALVIITAKLFGEFTWHIPL